LGERLRKKLFAEINKSSACTIFLMWEEDYDLFLSLRTSTEQAAKSRERQASQEKPSEGNGHKSPKRNGTGEGVQQEFSFQDLQR
jgi:hypothetical protein